MVGKTTLTVLLVAATAFAAFMWVLAYANGKIADELLREKLTRPPCAAVPYRAHERGARCLIVQG